MSEQKVHNWIQWIVVIITAAIFTGGIIENQRATAETVSAQESRLNEIEKRQSDMASTMRQTAEILRNLEMKLGDQENKLRQHEITDAKDSAETHKNAEEIRRLRDRQDVNR